VPTPTLPRCCARGSVGRFSLSHGQAPYLRGRPARAGAPLLAAASAPGSTSAARCSDWGSKTIAHRRRRCAWRGAVGRLLSAGPGLCLCLRVSKRRARRAGGRRHARAVVQVHLGTAVRKQRRGLPGERLVADVDAAALGRRRKCGYHAVAPGSLRPCAGRPPQAVTCRWPAARLVSMRAWLALDRPDMPAEGGRAAGLNGVRRAALLEAQGVFRAVGVAVRARSARYWLGNRGDARRVRRGSTAPEAGYMGSALALKHPEMSHTGACGGQVTCCLRCSASTDWH